MEIGDRIKAARVEAGRTQEQVAGALGVSRQTVSNWENGRTYPDIVSVIKMSGLYGISLDRLLKGEEREMSGYLEYLGESTDAVGSRTRLSKLILIAVYLGIWAVSLIAFWFFTSGSDAMGYGVAFLWVLLPVTTFVTALLIGRNDYWGRWKWLSAAALGLMNMLAEYGTFSAANMLAFGKINRPQWELFWGGAAVALLGLGLGAGIRRWRAGAGRGRRTGG